MSYDYWYQPWSDDPYGPPIVKADYIEEKATMAGSSIASILYSTPAYTFVHPH